MTAWSQACVCDFSLAGFALSKPAGGMDICLVSSVVCSQVEVSATGPSLVRRSPTECGVSECGLETSMMGPRSTSVFEPWGNITRVIISDLSSFIKVKINVTA